MGVRLVCEATWIYTYHKRGLSKKEWTARDHNGVLPNKLVNYVQLSVPPPFQYSHL